MAACLVCSLDRACEAPPSLSLCDSNVWLLIKLASQQLHALASYERERERELWMPHAASPSLLIRRDPREGEEGDDARVGDDDETYMRHIRLAPTQVQ